MVASDNIESWSLMCPPNSPYTSRMSLPDSNPLSRRFPKAQEAETTSTSYMDRAPIALREPVLSKNGNLLVLIEPLIFTKMPTNKQVTP